MVWHSRCPEIQIEIQQKKETMMINLKWAGICVAMALMFAVMSGVMVAQDAKIFEGTLMGVDPNTRVLTLKEGDMQMQ
jgi:hypothetical protein